MAPQKFNLGGRLAGVSLSKVLPLKTLFTDMEHAGKLRIEESEGSEIGAEAGECILAGLLFSDVPLFRSIGFLPFTLLDRMNCSCRV